MGFPVSVSHSRASPLDGLPPPVRNVPPSGLKATPMTTLPLETSGRDRVTAFPDRGVVAPSPASETLPAGLKTEIGSPMDSPVATFQSLAIPLSSPVRSILPSGLKAADRTLLGCWKVRTNFALSTS